MRRCIKPMPNPCRGSPCKAAPFFVPIKTENESSKEPENRGVKSSLFSGSFCVFGKENHDHTIQEKQKKRLLRFRQPRNRRQDTAGREAPGPIQKLRLLPVSLPRICLLRLRGGLPQNRYGENPPEKQEGGTRC